MRSLLTSVWEFQVWMTQQYRCVSVLLFFAGVSVLCASDAFVLAWTVIRIAMRCLCLGEKLWELSKKRVSSADKKKKKRETHLGPFKSSCKKSCIWKLLQAIWLISTARSYCDCLTCFSFSLSYIFEICRGKVCFDMFACWAADTICSYEHISLSCAIWSVGNDIESKPGAVRVLRLCIQIIWCSRRTAMHFQFS